jgi:hypothetical protein
VNGAKRLGKESSESKKLIERVKKQYMYDLFIQLLVRGEKTMTTRENISSSKRAAGGVAKILP